MEYHLTEKSCETFVHQLGSSAAVPGGGGASALTGAIGAALGSMAAILTIPNPRYAEVSEELVRVREELVEVTEELLACVEADAVGFEPLSKAYGLPRSTKEERVIRETVMERALFEACEAPVGMVELCARAIELLAVIAEKGAKLVISDAGAGIILTKAAMQAAVLNVYINTKMMKDRQRAEQLNAHCDQLIAEAASRADAVYASVCERIRPDDR